MGEEDGGVSNVCGWHTTGVCRLLLCVADMPPLPVCRAVHWGSNWGFEVPAEQRRFAHALVDVGGSHMEGWGRVARGRAEGRDAEAGGDSSSAAS